MIDAKNLIGDPQTIEEARAAMLRFAKAVCDDVESKWGFRPLLVWKDADTLHVCDPENGEPTHELHVGMLS